MASAPGADIARLRRSDCHRRRTAERLHVHPNTVDYRLDRVAQACGLDATDPAARPVVAAALAVVDFDRHTRP